MILARSALATTLAASLLLSPAALAANQTFSNVHYLVSTGDKAKQSKARLVLTEDSVQIHGHRGVELLREVNYSDIEAATYSRSKHPRWKTSLAMAAAIGVFAVPFLFTKGKKHWLTFQSEGEHIALRLSKKNYLLILAAVEGQTGLKVDRIQE